MPQRRGMDSVRPSSTGPSSIGTESVALSWLARQLQWERILGELRDAQGTERPMPERNRPAA